MTRLRLAGLAPAEVAELVADQVPASSAPDPVAAVVRAAEGNPLYALELAGTGARWPPASITDAVLARLGRPVGPGSGPWWTRSASPTAGCRMSCWPRPCRSARMTCWPRPARRVSRRLLVATADGYAFPHDLIRQVFYGQLLPGERRRCTAGSRKRSPRAPSRTRPCWPCTGSWPTPGPCRSRRLLAARQAVSARAYPEADHFYTLAVDGRWLPDRSGPARGSGAGGQLGRAS